MDVTQFKQKWIVASNQKERSASQSHFIDLCALLGVPTPTEADPIGETYCFERGANKAGGGDGWADVWYRGHFAIEYKGLHKDLDAAYVQVMKYKDALENPPLLVVCDLNTIRIKTNFTNTKQITHEVTLADLDAPGNLAMLKRMWTEPESFRPHDDPDTVTIAAAERFSEIAEGLRDRDVDPESAAHFLVQMVFCLFAEDIRLLPSDVFSRMVRYGFEYPDRFQERCSAFLQAMNTGGEVAYERIPYVNGGLFETVDVPHLTKDEIGIIHEATKWDWSKIEPAIFGTLFERSLTPGKRSQLGAHYTSKADIQRVVDPVVIQPLRRRFAEVVQKHGAMPMDYEPAPKMTNAQRNAALKDIDALLHELTEATILDPACGSGNFLYVALEQLLTLEQDVQLYRSRLTMTPLLAASRVQPTQLHGIEINPYAQQLAQTAIWIGFLQWLHRNRHAQISEPILSPLDSIELKDALLTFHDDGTVTETEWPSARFIIGNPPFLGGKLLRRELSDSYVDDLFRVFDSRCRREADLVVYFLEKARIQIDEGKSSRAGLLATNSIRGGANREVLKRIKQTGDIYLAWSDEPWVLDGAAVRISIVGFDDGTEISRVLDGRDVSVIHSDLTSEIDITVAQRLHQNTSIAFQGGIKAGKFDVEPGTAIRLLQSTGNPNRRPNSDVVRPFVNGEDVVRRNRGYWIIDFGVGTSLERAAQYEAPFRYVEDFVRPVRASNRDVGFRDQWWLHGRPRPELRQHTGSLCRVVVTPRVSKYRIFRWTGPDSYIDSAVIAIASEDDYFFGVLHSRAHELWSLRMGTWLGKGNDPRYTPTTTFETYPFPWSPGQEPVDDPVVQRIGAAAKELDDKRNAWLNPEGATEAQLKKRTLTNLYNENPTWLRNLHATLDRAVWDAYGWPADEIPAEVEEDVILSRLLALNLERAAAESAQK